jgi:hypothetical protein
MTSLLVSPTKVIAEPGEIINPVNLTVDEQIYYFSNLYQVDVSLIRKVIECESGGNHSSIGDNNLSRGILQFQRATFQRMAKLYGEDLNYESQYDQLKLGIYALSKPELAREWTSYVSIMKGGEYSFYSKQLEKYFTVRCKL